MKTIASFTVNHDKLEKGMYISRIDGDAVTYDIRMKKPNGGDYLTKVELSRNVQSENTQNLG